MYCICLIFVFFLAIDTSVSLHFNIEGREQKCFMEEVPEDTLVTGRYKLQSWDRQSKKFQNLTAGVGMHVEIKDPKGKIMLSTSYSSDGNFIFTSHAHGVHKICMYSNSTKWNGEKLRVYLNIGVGEQTTDYEKISSKEELTKLELKVRKLIDQALDIQKEQNYDRARETRFRETSENTNSRILWWSIAQTFVLFVSGMWQMTHLTKFFERKKLV